MQPPPHPRIGIKQNFYICLDILQWATPDKMLIIQLKTQTDLADKQ